MMLFTSREYGTMFFGGRRFTQRFEIHKRSGKYLVFSIKRRFQPLIDPVDCQHTMDAEFDNLTQAIIFVEACIEDYTETVRDELTCIAEQNRLDDLFYYSSGH